MSDDRVMQWIPCAERMPGHGPFLVYLEGASHHTGGDIAWRRTGIQIMWKTDDGAPCAIKGGWYRDDYRAALKKIDADYAEITHWMPLPPAPVAQKNVTELLQSMPVIGVLNIDDPHDPKNKELKL